MVPYKKADLYVRIIISIRKWQRLCQIHLQVEAVLNPSVQYSFLIKAYKNTKNGKDYFSNAETELKMGFTSPGHFRIASTKFTYDKTKKVLTRNDKLSWDKVYGAKGYYIDVYNPTTKKYEVLAKIKGANHTSYVVSNTLPTTAGTVTYRISSYTKDKIREGETVEVNLQIGKVSKVRVSKAGSSAKVSWNKVKCAETYRIYRSNGRSTVLVGTTDKLTYTDRGLSVGVTYGRRWRKRMAI